MPPETEIIAVEGHRRWDSRGRPTVEAVVRTRVGVGRALAPAGASTGSGEAVDLRDRDSSQGGLDVTRAVANINCRVAPALVGLDAADQASVDSALEALDPSESFADLGGNAAVAASLATAWAAANTNHVPLWRQLDPDATLVPMPEIQIFGGGAHANRRIDIQDLMVMPLGATCFAEALDWVADVYRAAGAWLDDRGLRQGVADEGGWWPAFDSNVAALDALVAAIEAAGYTPGEQVGISLDIAASEFGRDGTYRLALDDTALSSDALCEMLLGWLERYPIVAIEDPLAEDDAAGMAAFTAAAGDRVEVIGDDLLVTNAARVEDAAAQGFASSVLIKPNQAGTLSRARAALSAAQRLGLRTVVSARSGETEDTSVAHLAVGWSAGQVKVGSITRAERTAKWNELLRIEEELGDRARFAGRAAVLGS